MISDAQLDNEALKEAWRWVQRLDTGTISSAVSKEFLDWRAEPRNDAAYRRAERIHKASGGAAESPIVQRTLSDIDARASARITKKDQAAPLRRLILGPASMAALALAFLAASLMPGGRAYRTAVGERKTVTLPDGSSVTLDTGSQLRVQFTKGERDVALVRGQALFNVIHRPNLPFKVLAGSTTVTDLGTRFDVRKDSDEVKVTVLSGSAEVATAGSTSPAWILHQGQQVSSDKPTAPPQPADASAAASWTSGHLLFDDTPLSLAVAEVNRYGRTKVVLVGPALGLLSISGTFDTGDTNGFVAGVTKLHALTVGRGVDGSITLTKSNTFHPT